MRQALRCPGTRAGPAVEDSRGSFPGGRNSGPWVLSYRRPHQRRAWSAFILRPAVAAALAPGSAGIVPAGAAVCDCRTADLILIPVTTRFVGAGPRACPV
jgi:hypothetical protein